LVVNFCPDYLALLSVTVNDVDRYDLTCSPQSQQCLPPPAQTRQTADALHYRWDVIEGRGSFPLGQDGPAVAFRRSKSEDASIQCRVTDSGSQFQDGDRNVYTVVIRGKPPRAYVGVGNTDLGGIRPNPLKRNDAVLAAAVAAQKYRDAGYEVTYDSEATRDSVVQALRSPCLQAIWIHGHGSPGQVRLKNASDGSAVYFNYVIPSSTAHLAFYCPEGIEGARHPFLREIVALGCETADYHWGEGMVCGHYEAFDRVLYFGELGSQLGRRPLDWEIDEHRPLRAHDLRDE
jgi:hypothetical protein